MPCVGSRTLAYADHHSTGSRVGTKPATNQKQFRGTLVAERMSDDSTTYRDLVELAKICLEQSRAASTPEAARALVEMARDYQRRASRLAGGRMPDIGGA